MYVRQHLLSSDKGRGKFFSALLDLRVPLAAVSEQYRWH